MAPEDKKKPGVDFNLEEDAEAIFIKFLEDNEPVASHSDHDQQPFRVPKRGRCKVDLHGLTLDEAKSELLAVVDRMKIAGGSWQIRVVTGKGRHSGPGGGVLVREIYDFFLKNYGKHVVRIDSNPGDSLIQGLPIRGHFDAQLKF
jgi:DNA-nicking Smr family endonuclease